MISINFSFDTQYGTFSDALWLSENHTFTDAEIEEMKQQRLTDWLAFIEQPQVNVNGQ
jgi:hypothetical protein